jgi:mono/diheme cytochrome c family protein
VSAASAAKEESAEPRTRAELDARYEKDSANFRQEPSQNQNPSDFRAEAKPKTIEVVAGRNGYDVVMAKIQPEVTFNSVQAGKRTYKVNCANCHGLEGRPDAKGTLSRYGMANLSDPMQYKYGADARGIFRSIAFGTAAPPHGTYNGVLSDKQIWDIVAYIQSIQVDR